MNEKYNYKIVMIIYRIKVKRFYQPRLKLQGFWIMESHTGLFMPNVVSYNYLINY